MNPTVGSVQYELVPVSIPCFSEAFLLEAYPLTDRVIQERIGLGMPSVRRRMDDKTFHWAVYRDYGLPYYPRTILFQEKHFNLFHLGLQAEKEDMVRLYTVVPIAANHLAINQLFCEDTSLFRRVFPLHMNGRLVNVYRGTLRDLGETERSVVHPVAVEGEAASIANDRPGADVAELVLSSLSGLRQQILRRLIEYHGYDDGVVIGDYMQESGGAFEGMGKTCTLDAVQLFFGKGGPLTDRMELGLLDLSDDDPKIRRWLRQLARE